jgi:putative ABC transport system ATP-binding protein
MRSPTADLLEKKMTLVKLKDVSKIYHTNDVEFPALKGVSLTIEKGEFLSIAGPSGSGKTTLLNIIGCLDKPSGGAVLLDGVDIASGKAANLAEIRRQRIGFIFQTFNLIPILTAYENVEFPLQLKGKMSAVERRALVEEILTEVGLKDLLHRKPAEMSGGQQQRVAIARALVKKPQLILADEPTANLDSKTGENILDLMLTMNKKTDTTFIFSTHDRMVMDFARRIVHLKDGEIQADERKGGTHAVS